MAEPLEGLLLRQVDVGEADRIVSVLTDERGRVELRIPSARKSRKRFGGLDLFVHAALELSGRARKPRLEQARVLSDHRGIRTDVERLALASHAAELLVLVAPEEDPQPELFRLALAAFESLDRPSGEDVGGLGWARGFELKLLHVLGLRPSLRRCVASGEVLGEGTSPLWSVSGGGVLSPSMQSQDPAARPIRPATLAALDGALRTPLGAQAELRWAPAAVRGAASAMDAYLRQHLGARQRALAMLESLALLLVAALLLPGCSPTDSSSLVRMEGYLFDNPSPEEDEQGVEGARGDVWDDDGDILADIERPFSSYLTYYRMDGLPPLQRVHLRFSSDESVTTILTGWTPDETLFVDPGTFHLFDRETALGLARNWAMGEEAAHDFDPEYPDQGGLVTGSLAFPEEQEGTKLWATDAEGGEHLARVQDPLGDPFEGLGTGPDGTFAFVGLPEGPVDISVERPGEDRSEESFRTWVQEDAITSLVGFQVQ